MKLLNEANLVYFSTCGSKAAKEGWLYKKGEVNKNFQKRWFVLKGNLLFYFDKPGDREPNGVIILEGYTVELYDTTTDGFIFQIVFKGAANARRYILQAESHHIMEEWMKAITSAGYDYMKLMVAELKSQLDELTAQEISSELAGCKTHSDSVDPFGQQPFSAVEPQVTAGTGDSVPALVTLDVLSTPKARHNPFDRDMGKELFNVDPFGQIPFNPLEMPSTKLEIPPQAPTRKKNKSSPKPSPKISRKAPEPPPQSTSQVFDDPRRYFESEKPRTYIKSRFQELHTKYGNMIKAILAMHNASDSGPSLIDL